MFLNEEEEEGGGRGGRRARDDETYEEPGTLEIIFLQPSYDALPKTESYHSLDDFWCLFLQSTVHKINLYSAIQNPYLLLSHGKTHFCFCTIHENF